MRRIMLPFSFFCNDFMDENDVITLEKHPFKKLKYVIIGQMIGNLTLGGRASVMEDVYYVEWTDKATGEHGLLYFRRKEEAKACYEARMHSSDIQCVTLYRVMAYHRKKRSWRFEVCKVDLAHWSPPVMASVEMAA